MKMKTALLTALAVMVMGASCMAAPAWSEFDTVDASVMGNRHEFCAEKMAGWAERLEKGEDTYAVEREARRIFVRGDHHITYYDEWVVVDKETEKAFARMRIANIGAPTVLAEKLMAGGGEDSDDGEGDE